MLGRIAAVARLRADTPAQPLHALSVNAPQNIVRGSVGALTLVGMCVAAGCATTSPAHLQRSEWTLIWSDEFDGDSGSFADTTKWRPDTADGCQLGICGWGNQEKQFYTATTDNIALDGRGRLMIIARQARVGLSCYYGSCRYTSGKLTTRGRLHAEPGLVEARIKLPTGQGLWPAFWMLGASYPATPWPRCGELDIMEHKGSQPNITSSAIHGPGYAGNTPFVHAYARDEPYARQFHTFGVAWDAAEVRFFVDDVLHYRVTRDEVERAGAWVFDQPFFAILNLAVGGTFDGDPRSDDVLPAVMLVDYVRAYRRMRR